MILSPRPSSTPSRLSPSFVSWSFVIRSRTLYIASATPMRYCCTCRCISFIWCAGIVVSGHALSGTYMRLIIWRPYSSRGWRGWWSGGIPIRVWRSMEMPLLKTPMWSTS
jgi:hypothetical protein